MLESRGRVGECEQVHASSGPTCLTLPAMRRFCGALLLQEEWLAPEEPAEATSMSGSCNQDTANGPSRGLPHFSWRFIMNSSSHGTPLTLPHPLAALTSRRAALHDFEDEQSLHLLCPIQDLTKGS